MSVTVERGIKLIPAGGDNILKAGLISTSDRLSGIVDATSVPYVTSFTFNNQDVSQIIGLETLNDVIELDIRGNRYLSFRLGDHVIDQKPVKLYNISDTLCEGFINTLSTYSNLEFFYANNTKLSGDIGLPRNIKLAEIQGYSNKSAIAGTLAPLNNNPNLVYFNCSNNKLKGTVEIGRLPKAIHLDFSKNQFKRLILNTLTVQTSNVRVFNFADNYIVDSGITGLEDIYKLLAYFNRLKTQYQKGKSPTNNYQYVLNLSGTLMPGIPPRPYEYGYINLLMSEVVSSLRSEPYPWTVHMGDYFVNELSDSKRRARVDAFADPDVRQYIRNWELQYNEVIPTKDYELVDRKVKKLKSITSPISAGMIETINPTLTSTGRTVLSAVSITPSLSGYKWYIGSFWDLVGLNFTPDPDHTEYVEKYKKSFLESKGVSLIYYLELLWFIKTAKWLGIWNSLILWPLRYNQFVNKYEVNDYAMLMIESLGGGQVNPEYNPNSGRKGTHLLRAWFGQLADTVSGGANEQQPRQNMFNPAALSSIDGIPFDNRERAGTSRYAGLRITMNPALWYDLGFNGIVYMTLNTPQAATFSRSYLGGGGTSLPTEKWSQIGNLDTSDLLYNHYRTTPWMEATGRWSNNEHAQYNNGAYITPTGWPWAGGGYRANYTRDDQPIPNYLRFEARGNQKVNIFKNDPYVNPYPDPQVQYPYKEDSNFHTNNNGWLWTNWRDLKVTCFSGTLLNFNNNQNYQWKFWNSTNTATPPLTTLTYRYKCWSLPINSYDSTTQTIRFRVSDVIPGWTDNSKPFWASNATLQGRFSHMRANTQIKLLDTSQNTYNNYKIATVNTINRNSDGTYAGIQYSNPGDRVPRVTTSGYIGYIDVKINDGNVIFPNGSFTFENIQGFVPGATGVDLLSGGKGYTDGFYTNVPFQYTFSTQYSGSVASIPINTLTNAAPYAVITRAASAITSSGIPDTSATFNAPVGTKGRHTGPTNLNNLLWYYYGRDGSNRPIFWDSTQTYALWYCNYADSDPNFSTYRCYVITTTADANFSAAANPAINPQSAGYPHFRISDLEARYKLREFMFGTYRGLNSWAGYLTVNQNPTAFHDTAFTLNPNIRQKILDTYQAPILKEVSFRFLGKNNFTANDIPTYLEFKVWDANNTNYTNLPINSSDYDRYSKIPLLSARGNVLIQNGQVVGISATAPGRQITRDHVFTFFPETVGGTGEGAYFRVGGTDEGMPDNLKNSVTNTNGVGNYYFQHPQLICNTPSLENNVLRGWNYSSNLWGAAHNLPSDQNEVSWLPSFFIQGNEFTDENFITNHFIFNTSPTTINSISSIYVCARWLSGSSADFRGNDGWNMQTRRQDDRFIIDSIKNNNTTPIYGTLTIENTATGEGMAFYISDIIPEKQYRTVRSRTWYYNNRNIPIGKRPFLAHIGIGTDNTAYMGLDNYYYAQRPVDLVKNNPTLSAKWTNPDIFYDEWSDYFDGALGGANNLSFAQRDPISGVGFTPYRYNGFPTFTDSTARTTLFETGYEGTLKFVMLFKTSFIELCANRFLKGNTLHTAITSFFLETSGVDLTPDIR